MWLSVLVTYLIITVLRVAPRRNLSETYLLPEGVKPTKYDILFHVHLEKCYLENIKCPYEVKMAIDLNVTKPTSKIVLNSYENQAIENAQLIKHGTRRSAQRAFWSSTLWSYEDNDFETQKPNIGYISPNESGAENPEPSQASPQEASSYKVTADSFHSKTQQLNLKVDPPLEIGTYTLLLNINAHHPTTSEGFYIIHYKRGGEKRYMLSTQMEPCMARIAFPCFDEPKYKATFQVAIEYNVTLQNDGYSALSNTQISKEFDKDDKHYVVFKKTPHAMSTYVMALVLSDFSSSEPAYFLSSNDDKLIPKLFRTWGPKKMMSERNQNVSQTLGPLILEHLTKVLGIGYAFDKVEQIGIPDFPQNAMENWGLITYNEENLFPKVLDGVVRHLFAITTIMHELAHQWFGNLVTLRWWSDAWLNEGFASFFQGPVLDMMKVKEMDALIWDSEGRFVSQELQALALPLDSLPDSVALSSEVWKPKDLMSKFDGITYGKGGAVIRMWMYTLGKPVFFAALQKYLKDHAFKNTIPSDLMKAFNDTYYTFEKMGLKKQESIGVHLPVDPPALFADWYQKPGYPLLKVYRRENQLEIQQERFIQGTKKPDTSVSDWYIPLTYSTNQELLFNETKPVAFFEKGKKSATITFKKDNPKWYVLNNQVTGVYRVMYDLKNMIALRQVLSKADTFEQIHVHNRAQIIDDVVHLALSDHTKYINFRLAFSMMGYLVNEINYLPWRPFSRNIRLLLELTSKEGDFYDAIQRFAGNIVLHGLQNLRKKGIKSVKDLLFKEELALLFHIVNLGPKSYMRALSRKHFEFFDDMTMYKGRMEEALVNNISGESLIKQKDTVMRWIDNWCEKNCKEES